MGVPSHLGICAGLTTWARRSCNRAISRMRRPADSLIGVPLSQPAIARSENPVRREKIFQLRFHFWRTSAVRGFTALQVLNPLLKICLGAHSYMHHLPTLKKLTARNPYV